MTALRILLGSLILTLGLTGPASAQIRSTLVQADDEPTLSSTSVDDGTTLVRAALDTSGIDYADRPAHVFVGQFDDTEMEDLYPVHTLPPQYRQFDSQTAHTLSIQAFNPSDRGVKVRVQLVDPRGNVLRTTDYLARALEKIRLLDPDLSSPDTIDNVTFVVASDAPLVVDGHYRRAVTFWTSYADHVGDDVAFALGHGFSSESRRTIPFREIDCASAATRGACDLPMHDALWTESP